MKNLSILNCAKHLEMSGRSNATQRTSNQGSSGSEGDEYDNFLNSTVDPPSRRMTIPSQADQQEVVRRMDALRQAREELNTNQALLNRMIQSLRNADPNRPQYEAFRQRVQNFAQSVNLVQEQIRADEQAIRQVVREQTRPQRR